MELWVLWLGLISFIHVLGEIANGPIGAAWGTCICVLMSNYLTHRLIPCKVHLNMEYKMCYINSLQ